MPDSAFDISVPVGAAVMGQSGRASRVQSLLTSTLEEMSLNAGFAVPLPAPPKLGVDVVDIEVLARQLRSDLGPEFKRRVFTETEIAACRDEPAKFATRWAVKEAVSKAIGTGFREGLHPAAVEIFTAVDGSIGVGPTSGCGWPRGAECWTWTVSASHESGVAVAVVIGMPN